MLNGKTYRRSSPENNCAGAKAYEALLRQKIQRGESIDLEEPKRIDNLSFRVWASQWFNLYVENNNKLSEILNKKSILKAHLVPFFGSKSLEEISGSDVEKFKAKEKKANLSNKTINNFLIVLKRCLRVAQEESLTERVPKIKLLKVEPQKFDVLSENECQTLLNGCTGLIKDMILLTLRSGLRLGELLALQWTDIDFSNKLMTIRQSFSKGKLGSTKSNKIRYIPLLDEVCQMLASRPKQGKFVFSKDTGEPLNPMFCSRHLRHACKTAGLRKIRGFHSMRHTMASQLAINGVPIIVIKELLGHSDIRTTMRYAHLNPCVIREAMLSLSQMSGHKIGHTLQTNDEKITLLIPANSEIIEKPQQKTGQ
jgi:integrase